MIQSRVLEVRTVDRSIEWLVASLTSVPCCGCAVERIGRARHPRCTRKGQGLCSRNLVDRRRTVQARDPRRSRLHDARGAGGAASHHGDLQQGHALLLDLQLRQQNHRAAGVTLCQVSIPTAVSQLHGRASDLHLPTGGHSSLAAGTVTDQSRTPSGSLQLTLHIPHRSARNLVA